ncbi:unnamed protein product [Prorocentrum cordatum]|uniref:RRM domain-containing protein n=1 Tax=Prorocentrum cordatum TaxID=2364126 RepID=A0ABN9SW43_9DINO|nr:unnamed protein product [Polarella glacialis]
MPELPAGSVLRAAAAYHRRPALLAPPGIPAGVPAGRLAALPDGPAGMPGRPATVPVPASAPMAAGQAGRRTGTQTTCRAGPPDQPAGLAAETAAAVTPGGQRAVAARTAAGTQGCQSAFACSSGEQCAERVRKGLAEGASSLGCDASGANQAGTIGSCLQSLCREDSEHVVVVRRVNTLGIETQGALAKHFSAFGRVRRVLATQSKVATQSGRSRVRAGGIAYVVMADAESVGRILQAGPRQTVASRSISVEPYAPRGGASADAARSGGASPWAGCASSGPRVLGTGGDPRVLPGSIAGGRPAGAAGEALRGGVLPSQGLPRAHAGARGHGGRGGRPWVPRPGRRAPCGTGEAGAGRTDAKADGRLPATSVSPAPRLQGGAVRRAGDQRAGVRQVLACPRAAARLGGSWLPVACATPPVHESPPASSWRHL